MLAKLSYARLSYALKKDLYYRDNRKGVSFSYHSLKDPFSFLYRAKHLSCRGRVAIEPASHAIS